MMVPVVFLVLPVTVVFALFSRFLGFSFAGRARHRRQGGRSPRQTWRRRRHCGGARDGAPGRPDAAVVAWTRVADGAIRDRGDVPGWVLVTIMTAGLVTALWLVADDKLTRAVQATPWTGSPATL